MKEKDEDDDHDSHDEDNADNSDNDDDSDESSDSSDGVLPLALRREPVTEMVGTPKVWRPFPHDIRPFPINELGVPTWHTVLELLIDRFNSGGSFDSHLLNVATQEIKRVGRMADFWISDRRTPVMTPWHMLKIEECLAIMSFWPKENIPWPYRPLKRGTEECTAFEDHTIAICGERPIPGCVPVNRMYWAPPEPFEMYTLVKVYDAHSDHHGVSGYVVENHKVATMRQYDFYQSERGDPNVHPLAPEHHRYLLVCRLTKDYSDECPICSDKLKAGHCVMMPSCAHKLHFTCGIKFWSRYRRCATCRKTPLELAKAGVLAQQQS